MLQTSLFPVDAPSVPMVEQLAKEGAWVCFSCSGGKDSGAAIWEASRLLDVWGHPKEKRMILHADLGRAEWDSTMPQVEALAKHFDLPLHIVKNPAHDMFSRWERRGDLGRERWSRYETTNLIGPWSTPGTRFCTSEMKSHPLGKYKKSLEGPVITVMGLRRDESSGRAKTKDEVADKSMKRFGRDESLGDYMWNPVASWSFEQVIAAHKDYGIPLHEAYGLGSTRLSCNFCIMGSIGDLQISSMQEQNVEAYRYLVGMEIEYGFSFQAGRWLGDVNPELLCNETRRELAKAKVIARDRRFYEQQMPENLMTSPHNNITLDDAKKIAAVRKNIAKIHNLQSDFLDEESIMSLHLIAA